MDHHGGRPTNGDDIIHSIASQGREQKHIFARGGNDLIQLGFDATGRFSHGHHVRGDLGDAGPREGGDIFNFIMLTNVRAVVVGRIEDFDASRDEIQIEGVTLDFANLPENVRIVEYNGDHNDADDDFQQWILIDTGVGGKIFYALEGARIDLDGDGGANGGTQEAHFINSPPSLSDFEALRDIEFIDQVNVVPDGVEADGGVIINDVDKVFAPTEEEVRAVISVIEGSEKGDLIAAGLNDDTVTAGDGDDQVWGGSGHDVINGDKGDDILFGGGGNDKLFGDNGNEEIYGGHGHDFLVGGRGKDVLEGGAGDDRLGGSFGKDALRGDDGDDRLFGRRGADTLEGGSGDDILNGGQQNDKLTGGEGADEFIFTNTFGRDFVTDFEIGIDTIVLDGPIEIEQRARATLISNDGGEIVLLGIEAADLSASDFLFG